MSLKEIICWHLEALANGDRMEKVGVLRSDIDALDPDLRCKADDLVNRGSLIVVDDAPTPGALG